MDEKISLIVVTAGAEANLEQCVASCLNQDYATYEVIVISNRALALSQADPRLKVIVRSGMALADLRSVGVQAATAPYVMFLEATDFLVGTTALTTLMAHVAEYQSDLLMTNAVFAQDDKLIYPHPKAPTAPITANNYLLYARAYEGFRRLGGNVIAKALLAAFGADLAALSAQNLYLQLCQKAQRPVYDQTACYAYRLMPERPRPAFQWQADYHVSNLAQLAAANRTRGWQAPIPAELTLAICVDDYSADKIAVLLYSIEANNPQGGVIYLVHGPLAESAKQALATLHHRLVRFRVELLPLSPVDQHLLAQISLAGNHLPRSAYYRILLPNLLPEVDRVLYLDYDTLVLGDLTTLWHSDLAGNFLGCIRDQGVTIKNGWAKNLFGPDANNYFNSGVLLMDLALLRKYGVTGYFYQFILESTKFFVLGDQDAYNLYFKDAVQYLPIENNYVTQLLESSDPAEHRDLAQVTILHFLSAKKPWKDTTSYPAAMLPAMRLYRQYRQTMRAEYQLAKQVPQLTVLVLVDDEHDLARCLESIYYQDYPNLAVVVLDASSQSAQVLAICQDYQTLYDHLEYQAVAPTVALPEILKRGLAQTHGELVTLLSARNWFNNNQPFMKLVSYLQTHQLDLISGMRMRFVTAEGAFYGYPVTKEFTSTTGLTSKVLATKYPGDYDCLSGMLAKRQLWQEALQVSENEQMVLAQLLAASHQSATWRDYVWVRKE